MTTTVTVSQQYGYVLILSGGFLPILSVLHSFLAGRLRSRAKIPYPNHFATVEQAKSSPEAYAFNCAQRAHGNFLEHLPHTLAMLLVGGLRFPVAASVAGAVWGVSRGLYTWGYVNSEMGKQGGRRRLGMPYAIAEVALLGMSMATGWGLLNGEW